MKGPSLTIVLTPEQVERLQFCSICDKGRGLYVCQQEKCPNKNKLLYCNTCDKQIHNHGTVKIQNLQEIKVQEWRALKTMVDKIEITSKVGY